jgi:hypothetical protein
MFRKFALTTTMVLMASTAFAKPGTPEVVDPTTNRPHVAPRSEGAAAARRATNTVKAQGFAAAMATKAVRMKVAAERINEMARELTAFGIATDKSQDGLNRLIGEIEKEQVKLIKEAANEGRVLSESEAYDLAIENALKRRDADENTFLEKCARI